MLYLQAHTQAARGHDSLLGELTQSAEAMLPEMSDADQMEIKEQASGLKERISRYVVYVSLKNDPELQCWFTSEPSLQ